ncbi:MAG TPA: hypothetical protein VF815_11970 [Myxococcaceae bacterium]|jgi:hypothetical protein
MKTKILVGAVAALLYGGVALAGGNKDCPPSNTQASLDSQAVGDESLTAMESEPVDSSIGGSGMAGTESNLSGSDVSGDQSFHGDANKDAWGGSGTAGTSSDIMLRCQPVQSGSATGGSGWSGQSSDIGGSGIQSDSQLAPPADTVAPPAAATSDAFTPIEDAEEVDVNRESNADMRGLTVMLGGGVEGYTGALAPQINPGAAYGVTAAIKPSKVFGLELGYSGAVNNLDAATGGTGPDLVRNGGQAALTFGLGAAPVQPYVLGGIGFSDYNIRNEAAGFSDDLVGNVPVGAGLRTHIGDFTFDLRGNYNFLFDQDFAGVDDGLNENGRYSGTLNIGGTF